MRITISLILLVIFLILVAPATAFINVSSWNVGETFITWEWDHGLNVTDIYVDGIKMCGYESTMPSFDIMGLQPCELHNVTIFTDNDTGTNETYTLCGNNTYILSNVDEGTESTGIAIGVLGITIGGVILYKRKRDEEEDDMT